MYKFSDHIVIICSVKIKELATIIRLVRLVRLIKMCLKETYSKVRIGKHLSDSITDK
jgi:hypothetical protein